MIFIYRVIVDFVHNVQVFNRPKLYKNIVSNDAQCSETDACVASGHLLPSAGNAMCKHSPSDA